MQDEPRQPKQVRAAKLIGKGRHGPLTQRLVGRCQVDEIAGMRNDRSDAGVGHPSPEQLDLGIRDPPLPATDLPIS